MRKKIKASSIAEVVIAMTIIALCFGIASLAFVRSTRVMTNFQLLKDQTEVQCNVWKQLLKNEPPIELGDFRLVYETDSEDDSITIFNYLNLEGQSIWKQQGLK